jgi:hypothetical protein
LIPSIGQILKKLNRNLLWTHTGKFVVGEIEGAIANDGHIRV